MRLWIVTILVLIAGCGSKDTVDHESDHGGSRADNSVLSAGSGGEARPNSGDAAGSNDSGIADSGVSISDSAGFGGSAGSSVFASGGAGSSGNAGSEDNTGSSGKAGSEDNADSGEKALSDSYVVCDPQDERSCFDKPPSWVEVSGGFTGEADAVEFQGRLRSSPEIRYHEESARSGMCRLLTQVPSFCDPACEYGQVCFDGKCMPVPIREKDGHYSICDPPCDSGQYCGFAKTCVTDLTLKTAGTLTFTGIVDTTYLTGIVDTTVSVDPNAALGYYLRIKTGIKTNANITAKWGALVTVSASGDVVGPFELALQIPLEAPEPLEDWYALFDNRAPGQDVILRWANPDETSRISLYMTTGLGLHAGISPVDIECEGPDRGTLTLPGSFLDLLYAWGWNCGNCPNNYLLRYRAVRTQVGSHEIEYRVGH